jgi:cytochrome c-type biogenesis protein CcmH
MKHLSLQGICFVCLLSFLQLINADVYIYPFDNELQETRFQALLAELRCPKCQNQSLADSDAEIAKDLRQKVYDLLIDGKSDEEIRNYLINRYGDFISYRPPLTSTTLILWLGPLALLLFSIVLAVVKVMKNATSKNAQQTPDDVEVKHD